MAGITGGASLITSAKNTAFIREISEQKQNVLIFLAEKGRYPGDVNGTGKFGSGSGYLDTDYVNNILKEAEKQTGFNYRISDISAPYWELYLAGITDFEPTASGIKCQSYPCSKAEGKSTSFMYTYLESGSHSSGYYLYNFRQNINTINVSYYADGKSNGKPKILKMIDTKIDDGIFDSGKFVSFCYPGGSYASYDYSIANKGICDHFYYDLGF